MSGRRARMLIDLHRFVEPSSAKHLDGVVNRSIEVDELLGIVGVVYRALAGALPDA